MGFFFFLLFTVGCFYLYYRWYTSQYAIIFSHQEEVFPDTIFSTQAFYNAIETSLAEKELPGLHCKRFLMRMKGLFSPKREYLRIRYKHNVVDVCAAPYVHDFFVSWREGKLKRLSLFPWRRSRTFYEEDTEAIFPLTIRTAIRHGITSMQQNQGERQTNIHPLNASSAT